MNKATALADRLMMAQIASCTCATKTPEILHHAEDCHYRLFAEAEAALRAVPQVRVTAMPTIDLLDLADAIHDALEQFLNAMGMPSEALCRKVLEEALWNDKGSFAPALRELADRRTLNAPASGGNAEPVDQHIADEEWCTTNPDGSISLDAYHGKSREELKQRCTELGIAMENWQFTAIRAATDGGNLLINVREPCRSKMTRVIEAYSDDCASPPEGQAGGEGK